MSEAPPSASAAPPLELVVLAGDGVSVAPLPRGGSVRIGRAEDCDVRIELRSVSRHHAVLHIGTPLRIEDLGSANGILVRDRDLSFPSELGHTHPLRRLHREACEIALGERAMIGSAVLVVRHGPAVEADRRGAGAAGEALAVPPEGDGVVVLHPAMREVYAQAQRAASSLLSVLILGETGVGKEVLARAIHNWSPRAGKPFLELNCAALPESLLEAELFGHEKGTFTGAVEMRRGLFETADGGTIFLDEIGELPPPVQVKLLRVLEDRTVTRVGGRAPRRVDVRFLAATNRDLEAEVARGAFRQDLYFRLCGLDLRIPPLRERVSEIRPLAEIFLRRSWRQLDRPDTPSLSSATIAVLERYAWPGNVRELRNAVDRAVVLTDDPVLAPDVLPAALSRIGARASTSNSVTPSSSERLEPTLKHAVEAAERERIVAALDACNGNQTQAAKLLGVSLRTLVSRLDEYDIPRPRKRR